MIVHAALAIADVATADSMLTSRSRDCVLSQRVALVIVPVDGLAIAPSAIKGKLSCLSCTEKSNAITHQEISMSLFGSVRSGRPTGDPFS